MLWHTCWFACCATPARRCSGILASSCSALLPDLLDPIHACPPLAAGQASLINRALLEECVGSVVLALAVAMAGSGHLPTFKLLRGGFRDARARTRASDLGESHSSPG